jgi:hypothetical protein
MSLTMFALTGSGRDIHLRERESILTSIKRKYVILYRKLIGHESSVTIFELYRASFVDRNVMLAYETDLREKQELRKQGG